MLRSLTHCATWVIDFFYFLFFEEDENLICAYLGCHANGAANNPHSVQEWLQFCSISKTSLEQCPVENIVTVPQRLWL